MELIEPTKPTTPSIPSYKNLSLREKISLISDPENYCLMMTMDSSDAINNKRAMTTKEFIPRAYELEALSAVKSWRTNARWLKDIPIIIDYVSENEIKPDILKELLDLNVSIYYSDYKEQTKDHDYGFINVHMTGKYLPKKLEADPSCPFRKFVIHIDTDMSCLQPIPASFLMPLAEDKIIIGGYNEVELPHQRKALFSDTILNSDLIITKLEETSEIYSKFIDNINYINDLHKQDKYLYLDDDRITVGQPPRVFDIEEYGVDRTYQKEQHRFKVVNIEEYQRGEGYYSDPLNPVGAYFWHEHKLDFRYPGFDATKLENYDEIIQDKIERARTKMNLELRIKERFRNVD